MEKNGKEHSHVRCEHGKCLNHKPDWEPIGGIQLEAKSSIIGLKTFWLTWCCGKPMKRVKKVKRYQCRQCGRKKSFVYRMNIADESLAYCRCCGSLRFGGRIYLIISGGLDYDSIAVYNHEH